MGGPLNENKTFKIVRQKSLRMHFVRCFNLIIPTCRRLFDFKSKWFEDEMYWNQIDIYNPNEIKKKNKTCISI